MLYSSSACMGVTTMPITPLSGAAVIFSIIYELVTCLSGVDPCVAVPPAAKLLVVCGHRGSGHICRRPRTQRNAKRLIQQEVVDLGVDLLELGRIGLGRGRDPQLLIQRAIESGVVVADLPDFAGGQL